MSTQDPYPQYPEQNPAGQTPYGQPPGSSPYGQPPGSSPYGQPPGSSPYGQPPGSGEQPQSIRTAVLLMRIGAGLSLLSLVLTLATFGSLKDDIRAELQAQGSTFTEAEVDTAFNVAIGFGVIFGLIGVALWLWMAWANGKGKKWARVVATVLAGLGLLSLLLTLAGAAAGTTTLSQLLSAVTILVGIAAVVFLYRPDASAYYEANSRR